MTTESRPRLALRPARQSVTPLIIAIVAVFSLSLILLASHAHKTRRGTDDAYITYQYARHLAQGHGFVFNVGEHPTLGTSTPLYAGLLALGAGLGLDIPVLSIGIGILATSVALSLIVCIAWEFRLLAAGVIVAVIASVARLYWEWEGMETALYAALILGSILTAFRGWGSLGLFLATAATITRPDGFAVLVAVGLFLVRRWSWRTILPAASLLLTWLAISTLVFGSAAPVSGLAKITHDPRISGRFSIGSLDLIHQALPATLAIPDSSFDNHPRRATAFLCLLFSTPFACTVFLKPRRLSIALTSWLVFYLLGYELLRLPHFSWYYGPPAIVLALFAWMGIQAAVTSGASVLHWRAGLVAPFATWTIGVVLLAVLVAGTPLYAERSPERDGTYVLAATWLRQHADPGDTVVAYEVGTIAYVSGLRTVDLLGLTDPAARPHLRNRDFGWAIRDLPAYVFSNERGYLARAIFQECAFALNYRPAIRLPFREHADYVIYRRADPDEGVPSGHRSDAEWIDTYHPTSIRASLTTQYSLSIRNRSSSLWRAHTPDAPFLAYEWRDEHGRTVVAAALRTPFPCDVPPGQRILVSASVRAPERPGTYTLSWTLVRQGNDTLIQSGIATEPARVAVYQDLQARHRRPWFRRLLNWRPSAADVSSRSAPK